MVEVDQICSERTAKNVLRDLRKDGQLKLAELEKGIDYRIYPASFSDPAGANLVKTGGEEYVPEPEPEEPEQTAEPKLMTDGGQSAESPAERESTGAEGRLQWPILQRDAGNPWRADNGISDDDRYLALVLGKPPPL